MLYLVLLLVVAAFGLLIAALTTSSMVWAWFSVGLSVVAAVLLVVDGVRRRRAAAAKAEAAAEEVPEPVSADPEPAEPGQDPDAEPGEEDTDAPDVLVVSELETEVVVLDERPRYHLGSCRWLRDRETLSLPVREARELGFTPCAVCTPDRVLAARHRREGTVAPTE